MKNPLLIGMLSYNRIEMTKKAIKSLYENTNHEDYELIILDNGSDAETVAALKTLDYNNLEIMYEPTNIGVAKGINKILERRTPEQHFMKLDNDIVFKEGTNKDWIKQVTKLFNLEILTMSSVNKIGAVSIKPYSWSESEQKEHNLLPEYPEVTIQGVTFQYNPEGITGCSTIYNKNVLTQLKTFNEYGLYGYEDSMICTRMFLASYLPLYNNEIARVYHIDPGGETDYLKWKHKQAEDNFGKYLESYKEYTEKNKNLSEV